MKNFQLLIIALITSISVFANESEKTVKEAFKSDYASATNAAWNKDGDLYLVSFDVDGVKAKATYTEGGEMVQLIQYIPEEHLPMYIRNVIKSSLGSKKTVNVVTTISNKEGTSYFVRMEDAKNWYLYKIDSYGYSERVEKFKKA
ncbi:hypothetical protein [Gynurincola endophyticus]|jgi:hypothetical protein|uniref:hypothetical protein n=1 Tax=Gynurincola endophyticus TaxID=2479004 RepID=UPI000F8D4A35|nr:hypothetical protein [Gynurincola endophyticus]